MRIRVQKASTRYAIIAAAAGAVMIPALSASAQNYDPTQAQLLAFGNSNFGQGAPVSVTAYGNDGIELVGTFGALDTGPYGGDELGMEYFGPATPGLQGNDLDMLGPDSGFTGTALNVELLGVSTTGNSPSTTTAVLQTLDFGAYTQTRADNYYFNNGGTVSSYEGSIAVGQTVTSTVLWSDFNYYNASPNGSAPHPQDAIDVFDYGFQVYPDDDGTGDAGDQSGAMFSLVITPVNTGNVWNLVGYGDFNTPAAWAGQSVPNGVGVEADFFGSISAPSSVSTDTAITLGTIHFNNANEYVLDGAGSLTMQALAGSNALIQVDTGSDTINLPTTLASNTTLNVAAGSTLVFGNPLSIDHGVAISQTGGGTVTFQSTVTTLPGGGGPTLSVAGSSLAKFSPIGGKATFSSVTIGTGSTVDIGNNALDVNYAGSADPLSTIQGYLASGFHGGAWNGPGLISSSVATLNASSNLKYALGYIDGAVPPVNYGGPVPASGTIEIEPTLAGDATLSGSVSFYDFQVVLSNFGKANQSWDQGDFDYTGTVDFYDFQVVLSNFGQSDGALSSSELAEVNSFAGKFGDSVTSGLSLVSVPEPMSIGMLSVAGLGLLSRRRRSRS